jgi:hypothetical protein
MTNHEIGVNLVSVLNALNQISVRGFDDVAALAGAMRAVQEIARTTLAADQTPESTEIPGQLAMQ